MRSENLLPSADIGKISHHALERGAAFSSECGAIKTLIHRLRKRYTFLLREEVGRTVSDPGEIHEDIHALCEALIATEGRL